ncbi:MAG: carboxypeptidase-like regulatory domain-containing protein [Candidatus Marinimicrobia bacterium]|nr:carboxypeptidase-like regulatory domain-containing protein [Candidatus Neomarinimicrobiota bacterium]
MRKASLFLVMLAITSLTMAATTGKISGMVREKSTGEPMIGVNIIVEGTSLGAVTNIDGYYVILNVPPGFHELKASMIGYSQYTIKDIRVEIDRTQNINIDMSDQILEGESVTITAERKVIKMDVAASQRSVTAEDIEELPVTSISEVLTLQAGVSGFSVRGGGIDETSLMIDGIELKDERTNQPITGIPLSAVQEISVQTGGFSAEYGNVRSGVVNVVTKDGSGGYSGTLTIKHSAAESKHFGISPYDKDSFYMRPYLDEAVAWTGTENGESYTDANNNGYWDEGESYTDINQDGSYTSWDKYIQRQYPSFSGWNAVSESSLANDDPSDDLTPAGAKRLYEWQYRKAGNIVNPDINIDGGFGGPVPFIGEQLGNLRFYLSYRQENDEYLFPVSETGTLSKTALLRMTADVSKTQKLNFTYMAGSLNATTSSRGGLTSYLSSVSSLASQVDRAGFTMPWRLYSNEYWAPTEVRHSTFSAKFTHLLSSASYYEVSVKHIQKRYDTGPGAARDTSQIYEIFPGYFVDEGPVGFYGTPVSTVDGNMNMGGAVSTSRDQSVVKTTSLGVDYVNQVNQNNQMKAGFDFVYDDLAMEFGSLNYFLPEGNYWTRMFYNPYRLTAYIQDKMEFEGFIASLGLNAELISPNASWYDVDPYDGSFYSSGYSESAEDSFEKKDIAARLYLSPRLSISHPITVNSKLYFNYGHYRQVPTAESLFRVQRKAVLNSDLNIEDLTQLSVIGDPRLDQAKTISYELGYDHALFDTYLLHLAAYYKDISDQQDWTNYISANGQVNYSQLTANSYEDIRGFEADISKMIGDWLTGNVNFEYRVNTSGYFGIKSYYQNPSEQRDYLRDNTVQSKPRPTPRVKSVIDLHTPKSLGPTLLGQKPFSEWHLNILSSWRAGSWFTYNPNGIGGIAYNFRWQDAKSVDLKISKIFSAGNMRVKFFADINNALNFKTFSGYGFEDIHDYGFYLSSLLLPENKLEAIGQPILPGLAHADNPGDVRPDDVGYVPIEWIGDVNKIDANNRSELAIYYDAASESYLQYDHNTGWGEVAPAYLDKVVEDKAYIDMPNQSSFIFLSPRDIFLGINISYDF